MFRIIVTVNRHYLIKQHSLSDFFWRYGSFYCELETEPLCLRQIANNCYVLHSLSKIAFLQGGGEKFFILSNRVLIFLLYDSAFEGD